MNGTCYCYEGWEGIHCSEDVKECTRYPSICGNNAICQETNGSYTCLCNDGYEKTLEGLCESKCHIVSLSRVIFFRGGRCLWIIKNLLVYSEVVSWVIALICNTVNYFIYVRRDINSWVKVHHEIHDHWFLANNDDSTV